MDCLPGNSACRPLHSLMAARTAGRVALLCLQSAAFVSLGVALTFVHQVSCRLLQHGMLYSHKLLLNGSSLSCLCAGDQSFHQIDVKDVGLSLYAQNFALQQAAVCHDSHIGGAPKKVSRRQRLAGLLCCCAAWNAAS